MADLARRLRSWEGLLLVLLAAVVVLNVALSPQYLSLGNFINLFNLSIEKVIVALVMAFIIVNGEIDLSVASVMGLAASTVAYLNEAGTVSFEVALLVGLAAGALTGVIQGYFIAYVGLPSLAVTLAGMIAFRGLARVLVEDNSLGDFPAWFEALGQQPFFGPFPFALVLFALLIAVAVVVLQLSGFGRTVTVIGHNAAVARYSGVNVRGVKLSLFVTSGLIAALAGIIMAAKLGSVRGDTAFGFELDIITMVLLGGVSIFGGTGSLVGVVLAILIILNLRNGLGLASVEANTQSGIIGALLVLSVLVPNVVSRFRARRPTTT